jgi:PAS domain S-box-containing protein
MKALKAYAFAASSVGVALLLTLWISPLRERSPYLLFTLAVMVSASWGRRRGALATLLSTAMAVYFLTPPRHSLTLSSPKDLVPLLLFCIVSSLIIWISHRLHLEKERVLAANQTLLGSIAEQRKIEEVLRESEKRYRKLAEESDFNRRELESLINSMNDGLVVVDPLGNPLMMNQAARQMHGYQAASEASAQLAAVAELFELRDANGAFIPRERWPGSRALAGELVTNLEVEVVRRDNGKRFVGYYNAVPVRDQAGQIKLAVITITDITENKRIEQLLRDAQKLESIGLLAGGIAHDFNNLLVGVIGSASLALDRVPPDGSAFELLNGILKTGEQLAQLTRQMLAYAGKGRFVIEPVNLSELIPKMCSLVQPSIPKKIELRLDLDPDLLPIEGDKGQIQQVLMNLVINAAEAIGSDTGLITVKTGIQEVEDRSAAGPPPGKYVFLEVCDTGCGMDDAIKAKIFDPFFSTKFIGRGLGLAAVSGIVRGHKGAITVTSALGEGTRFTVLFPVPECVVAASPVAVGRTNLVGRGTVLVADDEEVVRQTARKALEQYGYHVLLADSGLAAIDVFKRHDGEITLVILDLSMPGMGGEEALPELRKIRRDVKIVVSSGYSEAETMRLFAHHRVSGFLQKPFTPTRLAETVKSAIAEV